MFAKRTDLALEAREIWQESSEKSARLPGVRSGKKRLEGYPLHRVEVLDGRGAEALGKPEGTYLTVDLASYWRRRPDFFPRAVRAVGTALRELLPEEGTVLVAGLGNRAMTPDALGPLALESVLATRHLLSAMPRSFSGFRPVALLGPGVLGSTGVETAEAVRALADRLKPAAVLAVDALASRRAERVCTAVQLSDAGIVPGSGVGNHRAALDRESLGVPVVSLGVPTVVEAATLAWDLLEAAGGPMPEEETLRKAQRGLMVTPGDIDRQVRELGKVIGYGVNWALQGLEAAESDALLG